MATFFAPGRRAAFSKLKKSFKNFPAASNNSQTRFIVARNFAPVRQEKSPPPILQGRGVSVATFFGHSAVVTISGCDSESSEHSPAEDQHEIAGLKVKLQQSDMQTQTGTPVTVEHRVPLKALFEHPEQLTATPQRSAGCRFGLAFFVF